MTVELTAAGFRLLMQDLNSSGIFNPTARFTPNHALLRVSLWLKWTADYYKVLSF